MVGYDNAHDDHHRHYFGTVEPIRFVSFEDTEARSFMVCASVARAGTLEEGVAAFEAEKGH